MEVERKLVGFVLDTKYEDLPQGTLDFEKNLILGVVGTTIAGLNEKDCEEMIGLVKEWGGKQEATILTDGHKVPAHAAAFVNSILARALDYEDGLTPGVHFTASIVPTALAAAELVGGCKGKEFLVAVLLGSELTAKLNACSFYDGFDPTGIASVFGATAAAGRIMHLNSTLMLDALALAFNRAGGSFQCNIDGVLAVRAIQGFVSEGSLIAARLAQKGITGPPNFVEGIYGYLHLYGKDRFKPQDVTKDLGTKFELHNTLCKRYPSCGNTLSSTEGILEIVAKNDLSPEEVARVEIRLTPYGHKLVGHPFKIGNSPRVDAQFNVQYCVANAILRKSSKLIHFEESYIKDPKIKDFVQKIYVIPDPALQDPGSERSLSSDVTVTTKSGKVYHQFVKTARGMPGSPLSKEEHLEHFQECMSYAKKPLPKSKINKIVSFIDQIEGVEDIRNLISLMLVSSK